MAEPVHVERVNLTGGPLDDGLTYVTADQQVFELIAGDRTHSYLRIASINWIHKLRSLMG